MSRKYGMQYASVLVLSQCLTVVLSQCYSYVIMFGGAGAPRPT